MDFISSMEWFRLYVAVYWVHCTLPLNGELLWTVCLINTSLNYFNIVNWPILIYPFFRIDFFQLLLCIIIAVIVWGLLVLSSKFSSHFEIANDFHQQQKLKFNDKDLITHFSTQMEISSSDENFIWWSSCISNCDFRWWFKASNL